MKEEISGEWRILVGEELRCGGVDWIQLAKDWRSC
jgi:hypothetical protein